MKYDLWDVKASFFFDRFATEQDALAYVRALLDQYGDAYADDLELVIGEGGRQNLTGAALVTRTRGLLDGDTGERGDGFAASAVGEEPDSRPHKLTSRVRR